jgi:cytochrome c553
MIKILYCFILFILLVFSLITGKTMAAEIAAGKAKAQAICQTCHGMNGIATVPMVANISGQQEGYLIAQLKNYRAGKRVHPQMNIIAKMLTDEEIEDVAKWYSSMKLQVELPE